LVGGILGIYVNGGIEMINPIKVLASIILGISTGFIIFYLMGKHGDLFLSFNVSLCLSPIYYNLIDKMAISDPHDLMEVQPSIPILGTFLIDEDSGKKYKILLVEEVKEEPLTDREIVSKTSSLLNITNDSKLSSTQTEALYLINLAIEDENKKDKTEGPFVFWWAYSLSGDVTNVDSRREYSIGEAYRHPYQFAKSRQVIRNVVKNIGVDIFRIAAGVERKGL